MEGEIVFLYLFDVGRSIDLNNVESIFPGKRKEYLVRTKDTPSNIDIPRALNLEIHDMPEMNMEKTKFDSINVKIYGDGVITLIARIGFNNLPLEQLHEVKEHVRHNNEIITIHNYLRICFKKIHEKIDSFIIKYEIPVAAPESEYYTLYCINNKIENVKQFISSNQNYLAALLMGENLELNLHPKQIESTLQNPFSFSEQDLVIFDFERCLVIDPTKDYDDIILIAELANYQLLELRTLDRFLDKRITEAESDIKDLFIEKRFLFKKVKKKLGSLFRLRYDMIFILENLENISKFIGDYYLAQLYAKLNDIFQLDQWSNSIRNRMNALDKIYSTAKENNNERLLLLLEIIIVIFFLIDILLVIAGF